MRPRHDNIDEHRQFILESHDNGDTINIILENLQSTYNVTCSRRTLYRRLQQWSSDNVQTRTKHTPELESRIREMYSTMVITDQKMYAILREEGYTVSLTGVGRIRRLLGLSRVHSDDEAADEIERLRNYLEVDMFTTNRARGMGRRMFFAYIRTQLSINISQTRAWKLYGEYHSEEINLRSSLAKRRRHGWTVPGPNYTWSIDGYAKLAVYGFEVYAAVDAYSRFIPWFFVGHSAFTAQSVVLQYLHVVTQTGILPRIFRSDRGGETSLLARAHYFLSVASRRRVNIPQHNTTATTPLRVRTILQELEQEQQSTPLLAQHDPIPFSLCWSYSKSIYNVKIERWWGELCSGRTEFWRVCFFFCFYFCFYSILIL